MRAASLSHSLKVVFIIWLCVAADTLSEASRKEYADDRGTYGAAVAPSKAVSATSPHGRQGAAEAAKPGNARNAALHNASRHKGDVDGASRIASRAATGELLKNETRQMEPQAFSRAVQDVDNAVSAAARNHITTRTYEGKVKHWRHLGKGLYDYRESQELAAAVLGAVATLDTVNLWPIREKMLMFLAMFVLLEYIVDYFPWRAIKGGVQPDIQKLSSIETFETNSNQRSPTQAGVARLGSLSVLTLNVWVNKVQENLEKQIRGIRELQPDVVCLQEVFHLDVFEAYRTAFPNYRFIAFGRGHTITALTALMFIMVVLATTFSALIAFVERVTNGRWRITWLIVGPVVMLLYLRIVRHHWTIAFLKGNRTGLVMLIRKDTVQLDDKRVECIPFERRALAADQLNKLRPRGFISAPGSFTLCDGQEVPVRFCTTHLNQPLEQRIGEGRHRQVRQVLDHCVRDGEFLVVGCDLNATPPGTSAGTDCQSYKDVCKELSDAWVDVNPSDPCRDGLTWDQKENPMCTSVMNNFFYGNDKLRWRCDYIFWRYRHPGDKSVNGEQPAATKIVEASAEKSVDLQCQVRSCKMVFTGQEAVSDHFGVYTVFDFREGSGNQA